MVETTFIGNHDPTSRKRKKLTGEEPIIELPSNCWILYIDGSATKERSGAGIVLGSPDREHTIKDIIRFKFPASNNQAEYEALIFGIELASFYGATKVAAFCDSQLVVKQIKGEYNTQHPTLTKYKDLVLDMTKKLDFLKISQIGREDNQVADVLSKLATIDVADPDSNLLIVFVEELAYERLQVMCSVET